MKKIITLAFVAFLAVAFVGCEQKSTTTTTPPTTSTNATGTNAAPAP